MRLLRSSELVESGEMEESVLFLPSRADASGLMWPDPSGEGNSSPSSEKAELGRFRSWEMDVGVPQMLGKSDGDVSPYMGEGPKLQTLPLLVRLSLCLLAVAEFVSKGSLCTGPLRVDDELAPRSGVVRGCDITWSAAADVFLSENSLLLLLFVSITSQPVGTGFSALTETVALAWA